jgi:hypothetical protein
MLYVFQFVSFPLLITLHTSLLKSVAPLSRMEALQMKTIARSWLARGIALRPAVELTNLELTLSSFTRRPSVSAYASRGKTIKCIMTGFSSCVLSVFSFDFSVLVFIMKKG